MKKSNQRKIRELHVLLHDGMSRSVAEASESLDRARVLIDELDDAYVGRDDEMVLVAEEPS